VRQDQRRTHTRYEKVLGKSTDRRGKSPRWLGWTPLSCSFGSKRWVAIRQPPLIRRKIHKKGKAVLPDKVN